MRRRVMYLPANKGVLIMISRLRAQRPPHGKSREYYSKYRRRFVNLYSTGLPARPIPRLLLERRGR